MIYYVSPTGNDAGAGTIGDPWLTWAKAFNSGVVIPGDTVYFRGGNYLLSVTDGTGIGSIDDGTLGNLIYYWAYPGETPVLDCSSVVSNDGRTPPHVYAINANASYCHFKGLTIKDLSEQDTPVDYNYGDDVITWKNGGSYTTFENCIVHGIGGKGYYNTGDSVTYRNCDAYNCIGNLAPRFGAAGERGTGFYTNNNNDSLNTHYFGCRAWNNSDQGWAHYDTGYVEIDTCWSFNNGSLGASGSGFKLGYTPLGGSEPTVRRLLKNSIAACNRYVGVNMNDSGKEAQWVNVYNNFSYHNGHYPAKPAWGWGFALWETTSSEAEQKERFFKNNIAYDNAIADVLIGIGTVHYTHEYNSWDIPVILSDSDFLSLDCTELERPRKSDGSLPDIDFGKPVESSPAVGAGIDLGLLLDGAGLLWRLIPAIGAFEYYATAPPYPPAPTPTEGLRIGAIKINISRCAVGVYLRWYFNGWHYFNFTNGYEIIMRTESMGTQVTRFFSVISKVERPTRLKAEYLYKITVEGIAPQNIGGFTGLIMAEKVEQYEDSVWREVEVSRGSHTIRSAGEQGFEINFEVYRKELPESSAVFLKSLELYLGDTLCDMDDSEIVPINKQTNDIAEMQDRQSDFTAQFRIRKTRAMRALFELSGEVGASTDFPFIEHECKLIQDHIEIITGGLLILKKGSDQYYNATILSGNKNFFKTIELLKLNDLTLAGAGHTWDVATMAGTHAANLDYVYPLLEPSDDGGITPISDDGDRVDMYGGWIWPFINVKTIWDEIFSDAGYICEGDILTNETFTKLHIPISSRSVTKGYADRWLYSMWWDGAFTPDNGDVLGLDEFLGTVLVNGTYVFHRGFYITQFDADYKIFVSAISGFTAFDPFAVLTVYLDGAPQDVMLITSSGLAVQNYEYTVTATAGQTIAIVTNQAYYRFWSLRIVEIVNPLIGYSSTVEARNHIPAMSQTDFIKTICNMFGLIPDVTPRDRKIRFWNYLELYENIFKARDWSAYLSERDDETEFKYGDYARDNYLRYRESEDVINDTGTGSMQIDDTTLPAERDVVELPLSTADEVIILDNIFPVNVSRIAMNKYDIDDSEYIGEKTIDPRIVYVDHIRDVASPAYEKTMGLRATVAPGATTDVDSPKKSTSIDVSFASLVISNPGYAGLSRLLTKTNLRRAKFNLPVYEVAGLKHYIPIYLSQYKAYFYVNKINNYVPGKLCTIELIKL